MIAPGLRVLFCGINPGPYSAAVGHHFARPSNRFWGALYVAGFTRRLLRASEEHEMLSYGLGITDIVQCATATAAELSAGELVNGGRRLRTKVRRHRPRALAVLGIRAYRMAFSRPWATFGEQPEMVGATRVWVLPNPSALNAAYPPARLAVSFRELRRASERGTKLAPTPRRLAPRRV